MCMCSAESEKGKQKIILYCLICNMLDCQARASNNSAWPEFMQWAVKADLEQSLGWIISFDLEQNCFQVLFLVHLTQFPILFPLFQVSFPADSLHKVDTPGIKLFIKCNESYGLSFKVIKTFPWKWCLDYCGNLRSWIDLKWVIHFIDVKGKHKTKLSLGFLFKVYPAALLSEVFFNFFCIPIW